ncbi:MAG: heptaprenylglyceryl phosphate synthase [Peptococcaceae bacterium]|nr:heptaprenylglyceryl phosphate synthase [Peptococcaceae bacterium]
MWHSENWKKWRLVVKLDPDKSLPAEAVDIIKEHNVDAVMVGGTQGINYFNTANLVRSIREAGFYGPLVQEISAVDAVVQDVDAHFIPVVLNTGDIHWLVGAHLNAVKTYGKLIQWDKVLIEGYLVGNRSSAVGRITRAGELTVEDAVAYTVLAEEIFRIPVLYLEYSGIFGDLEIIRAVSEAKKSIHLVYGGGIKTPEQLQAAALLADTAVIGNIIYENPAQALEVVKSFMSRRKKENIKTLSTS